MPDLLDIKRHLSDTLHDYVEDQARFLTWLDDLFSERFGQVLGVSLYVDLICESVSPRLVADVVNRMNFPFLDARSAFASYPTEELEQRNYVCKHQAGGQPLPDDDQYVRVLKLNDAIEFYFRYALALPGSTYEAEEEVLDFFVRAPIELRRGLGVVRQIWRGGRMNVWVASKKELEEALGPEPPTEEIAHAIRNRFGFHDFNRGRLIYVVYPSRFDHSQLLMPTTLDINQNCRFYVSNTPETRWGMTCGLDSRGAGFKERVHPALDGLTDEFRMELVGKVSENANADAEHLLDEALRRAAESVGFTGSSFGGSGD